MIKSLFIKNFQSHKNSQLNFSPGVNVIIGKTDSGKSSIIKALKWLIWNRPVGEEFRSDWGGETKVEIFTKKYNITRRKDKTTINEYKLIPLEGGDALELRAFKTDVPEEIQKALNMNKLNFQSQFDRHFLLSSTPGEVAIHFNKIAHIDQIDVGLKRVQQWIRVLDQDINIGKGQIVKFKNELTAFEDLDKFEAEVEVLERMETDHQKQAKDKGILNNLISSIRSIQKDIEDKSDVLKAEKQVVFILADFDILEVNEQNKTDLNKLINQINEVTEEVEEEEEILSAKPLVEKLIELYEEKETMETERQDLQTHINLVRKNLKLIARKGIGLKELEKKFKKEMPKICPLCNQKIKK